MKFNINIFWTNELKENIKKDGCFVEIKGRNDKEILMKRTTLFCIDKDELKNLRSDDDDAIFINGTVVFIKNLQFFY